MEEEIKIVQNRIWITERCHMKAEKRSRFLELYFHIVLASFALATIGISVLNHSNVDAIKDSILSFASITTLCLSLLIFGFKFGETAAHHRSCYLALQKLRATKHEDHLALERAFIEVLGHYPNHTYGDYMRLAISNIWGSTQELESPPGKKVELGRWDRLVYAGGWLLARFSLLAFALMPPLMALYGTDALSVSSN
ncbi:SLATT domain-containing protein [uncultured Roseobacter sp.]|uniref:SLATT domain-containing protein n=1 Tax=uncultured Roseobacter sp. TaxID=114847 RepID=UPI00261FCC60|nr:SLATT domain-containing protein [uncultured Roseobacter sp.]